MNLVYVQEKVVLGMGTVLLVENFIKIQKYYHSVYGKKRLVVKVAIEDIKIYNNQNKRIITEEEIRVIVQL